MTDKSPFEQEREMRMMESIMKRHNMEDFFEEFIEEVYVKGYELGYGVEELEPIDYKTARSNFDRWRKVNLEW